MATEGSGQRQAESGLSAAAPRYRKYLNQLQIGDYLRLELAAHQRGMTPYQLSSSIVECWLRGQVYPMESPAPSPSLSVAGA